MVATEFLNHIAKFSVTSYAGVEDFADKFNFILTVIIILISTAIVTVKQYILKPITCYIATEVGGTNLLSYVENYCWVQGTLPVSYEGKMPTSPGEWTSMEEHKILYYQWVPFVLGIQCILFYLPRLIWQTVCYNRTGADLEFLIKQSAEAAHAKEGDRKGLINNLASSMEHLLFQQEKRNCLKYGHNDQLTETESIRKSSLCLSLFSKFRGNRIFVSYLLIKCLYLFNATGQLILMQYFLGFHDVFPSFGFHVLQNMIHGHDWQETLVFPRVGFCFVQMKILGVQTNGVTAQCALPVNMLNEKIYVFLWWWIMLAATLTCFSLFCWLIRLCRSSREADYVVKYIQLSDHQTPFDERIAHEFASQFLRRDGAFLTRMMRTNAGDILTAAVINCLWSRYLQRVVTRTHHPLSNIPLRTVGWSADLERGGLIEPNEVRNRKTDMPEKEFLYPEVVDEKPKFKNENMV